MANILTTVTPIENISDSVQTTVENIATSSPSEIVSSFFATSLMTFIENFIACLLILYIGFFIIKKVEPYIRKVISKTINDVTVEKFLAHLLSYLMKAIVVIIAIAKVGIETTSLVALLGAVGFAIGLAFQGALSHFAGGILILTQRPFSVGDFVKISGEEGNVYAISLLSTTLHTLDNKVVHIPNGNITTEHIVNYTKLDTRRVDISVTAAYKENSTKVIEALKEICAKNNYVLDAPKTEVFLSALLDSSVEYKLRAWVETENYWTAYYELMEAVKLTFDEKGIEIPFNQLDVNIIK